MSNIGAIGIFDSGVGGLTIWNEINQLLPNESTNYIGDSFNAPYGIRPRSEIINLSIANTQKLIDLGSKIIVVACNTATTQAIDVLRGEFNIPIIGIEPAIKPAAKASITRSISVLATHGTLESEHFNKTKNRFAADLKVVTRVGEGLVKAIEKEGLKSVKLKTLLKSHLDVLVDEKTDHLVLGCTHYPLLIPLIEEILGKGITIVDSGKAVAMQTQKILMANDLLNPTRENLRHNFYSTMGIDVLKGIVNGLGFENDSRMFYSPLYQSE